MSLSNPEGIDRGLRPSGERSFPSVSSTPQPLREQKTYYSQGLPSGRINSLNQHLNEPKKRRSVKHSANIQSERPHSEPEQNQVTNDKTTQEEGLTPLAGDGGKIIDGRNTRVDGRPEFEHSKEQEKQLSQATGNVFSLYMGDQLMKSMRELGIQAPDNGREKLWTEAAQEHPAYTDKVRELRESLKKAEVTESVYSETPFTNVSDEMAQKFLTDILYARISTSLEYMDYDLNPATEANIMAKELGVEEGSLSDQMKPVSLKQAIGAVLKGELKLTAGSPQSEPIPAQQPKNSDYPLQPPTREEGVALQQQYGLSPVYEFNPPVRDVARRESTPPDLSTPEGVAMYVAESVSEQDLISRVKQIKAAYGGEYPSSWYQTVVLSGLLQAITSRWEEH